MHYHIGEIEGIKKACGVKGKFILTDDIGAAEDKGYKKVIYKGEDVKSSTVTLMVKADKEEPKQEAPKTVNKNSGKKTKKTEKKVNNGEK